jgi:D-lactate dehydrogenase
VLIDTGDLVRRLRAEEATAIEQGSWKQAAKHWDAVTRLGGTVLTIAKKLPAPLVTGGAAAARVVLGPDTVPLWEKDLPGGGVPRVARPSADPVAVYFSACIGTMFGPAEGAPGVSSALLDLCDRAGVQVTVPEGIGSMCCGTPWKSKGFTSGYDEMRERVLPALWEASDHGRLPVVCDAASCTEGLERLMVGAAESYPGLRIVDAVAFVDEHVLVGLTVSDKIASLALHPTCSSTHLGTNEALSRIAAEVAVEVVIPDDWGCCAFAGDRGMLHPELTASATRREAASLADRSFTAYASTNRTCELGMTRATGHPYQHLLEVLEQVTR